MAQRDASLGELDRERWSRLASALGLAPREPVVLAFSGGADSVLLLHWLCVSDPRPAVIAVHVHHGLRGAEADADAEFCAATCRAAGVSFRLRRVALDPQLPALEERAREARYRVLLEEARRARVGVLLTAHQADDALETTLMRWMRGTDLAGLAGIDAVSARGRVRLIRPLLALRRAEVRQLAEHAGLAWREDSSNHDPRFTRTRVREAFLPELERLAGASAVDNLRHFAQAVDALERQLSARTAELEWKPLLARHATRRKDDSVLGGTLRRSQLARLPSALRRRALWRLVVQGTSHAPSRRLLALLEQDIDSGACVRRTLPGGWRLCLRSLVLELHPPLEALAERTSQAWLPFRELAGGATGPRAGAWLARLEAPPEGFHLPVPGSVTLPDGRRIVATWSDGDPQRPVPRDARVVELDPAARPDHLRVRWPREGDRFHPLGAPGSRPLRRFLADARVPSAERRFVPVVWREGELLWVAGLRPAESAKVGPASAVRLRLELLGGPGLERGREPASARARPRARQAEFDFGFEPRDTRQ